MKSFEKHKNFWCINRVSRALIILISVKKISTWCQNLRSVLWHGNRWKLNPSYYLRATAMVEVAIVVVLLHRGSGPPRLRGNWPKSHCNEKFIAVIFRNLRLNMFYPPKAKEGRFYSFLGKFHHWGKLFLPLQLVITLLNS